jgi:hypothetical protein
MMKTYPLKHLICLPLLVFLSCSSSKKTTTTRQEQQSLPELPFSIGFSHKIAAAPILASGKPGSKPNLPQMHSPTLYILPVISGINTGL